MSLNVGAVTIRNQFSDKQYYFSEGVDLSRHFRQGLVLSSLQLEQANGRLFS